jgi:hypothetical protein
MPKKVLTYTEPQSGVKKFKSRSIPGFGEVIENARSDIETTHVLVISYNGQRFYLPLSTDENLNGLEIPSS